MKKSDVKIGNHYKAKVTNKIGTVEILSENPHGGWDAKNLSTGKSVRIKSAQRLRGAAPKPNTVASVAAEEPTPSQPATQAESTHTPQCAVDKRLSALDAAAMVLEKESPLTCRQLIEQMAAAGLWKSDAATPANTLSAAITKEIRVKGSDSRFEKVDRGQFALSTK